MEFVGGLSGSSQTNKKIQNQALKESEPQWFQEFTQQELVCLCVIYLKLKVLGKTVCLMNLAKSNTCPLAGRQQGVLTDLWGGDPSRGN